VWKLLSGNSNVVGPNAAEMNRAQEPFLLLLNVRKIGLANAIRSSSVYILAGMRIILFGDDRYSSLLDNIVDGTIKNVEDLFV
jgi:hypothetical protein